MHAAAALLAGGATHGTPLQQRLTASVRTLCVSPDTTLAAAVIRSPPLLPALLSLIRRALPVTAQVGSPHPDRTPMRTRWVILLRGNN